MSDDMTAEEWSERWHAEYVQVRHQRVIISDLLAALRNVLADCVDELHPAYAKQARDAIALAMHSTAAEASTTRG